eukprot:COSAG05_NODE_5672_length_1118_cov_1.469087_1_plen_157_part_01
MGEMEPPPSQEASVGSASTGPASATAQPEQQQPVAQQPSQPAAQAAPLSRNPQVFFDVNLGSKAAGPAPERIIIELFAGSLATWHSLFRHVSPLPVGHRRCGAKNGRELQSAVHGRARGGAAAPPAPLPAGDLPPHHSGLHAPVRRYHPRKRCPFWL